MRRDHYIKYTSEETIASLARAWRRSGDIDNCGNFDIVDFVENILLKKYSQKGHITIVFFDPPPGGDPAYVTYNPLTLHIDPEVLEFAKRGDPDSRFVLAHEIGHILLHDHYARPFSNDPALNIPFALDENSAEWQANTFAGHFLLPDHIVRAFGDAEEIIASCGVPRPLAEERVDSVNRSRRHSRYGGQACERCGNFSLVSNGTSFSCDCGWAFSQ